MIDPPPRAEIEALPNDGALLDAFSLRRSDTAFTSLVERHAALVRGTCRRILTNAIDIDDAMQATWMVLASKAADLQRTPDIGPWLHAVAWRCAQSVRRRPHGGPALPQDGESAVLAPSTGSDLADALGVLDEALAQLPELERAALVLCHLEGQAHLTVAEKLGIPSGSLSRVLGRGLERLRQALAERGVAPALVLTLLATAGMSSAAEGATNPQAVAQAIAFAQDPDGPARATPAGAVASAEVVPAVGVGGSSAIGVVLLVLVLLGMAALTTVIITRAPLPASGPPAPPPAPAASSSGEVAVGATYRVIDGARVGSGFITNWDDTHAPVLVVIAASEPEWLEIWHPLPDFGTPTPTSDDEAAPPVPSGVGAGAGSRANSGAGQSLGAMPSGPQAFRDDLLIVIARVVPGPVGGGLENPLRLTGTRVEGGQLSIDYTYLPPAEPSTYSIKVWLGVWVPRATFTHLLVRENGEPVTPPLVHP